MMFALGLASAVARGQELPARAESNASPPEAKERLSAPYPAGAHGDAEVTLELVVDTTGRVTSAKAISGDDPFASAAVTAAHGWFFSPARRDGKPLSARIRVAIGFHEEIVPAPESSPPPSAVPNRSPTSPNDQPPPPPSPPTSKPEEALEVNVRGKQPPGTQSMTRAEVRLLPGAFGDPFRAIEAMPGVTPIASGLPYFYVRGAPPGNVGYYLDDVRVPILFHLGLGPSVVHPSLIDRVDLFEGGYPAQYGRFAGAIVTGETRPPRPEFHAEGNVRLVDAGALVEAPFADGNGTALVGGRYGYTTLLLKLIEPNVDLAYWDYQTRASYRLSADDQITAFAFGSFDHWATRDDSSKPFQTLFDATFHRLDLRYDHLLSGGGSLRQAVTLGLDRTGLGDSQNVFDKMIAARTEIVKPASHDLVFRFGADFILDSISSDLGRPGDDHGTKSFDSLFPSRADLSVGVRGDAVIQLGPRLELTPGIRVDLYGSHGATAIGVDPRLSSRLALTDRVRLVQAIGVASQPPSFFLPGPGLTPELSGGLQRSFQTSAGFEWDLPLEIESSLVGFHDAFFNMTDPLGATPSIGANLPDDFSVRSNGQAYGLEVSIKRKLSKKLGGFLAYTLSRSIRTRDVPVLVSNRPVIESVTFPSTFDRTHVLNAALSYDFGRGYHAGARVMFYTGSPSTLTSTPTRQEVENPDRLPVFFRLDVRFEKRWNVGKAGYLSFVVELLNATFSKEVVGVDCGTSIGGVTTSATSNCQDTAVGPVTIPSIGIEGGF
jgi:TonB family protein